MFIEIIDLIMHVNAEIDREHLWGYELRLINNENYCGKFLVLNHNDAISSLHYHKEKTETFIILSGEIELEVNGVVMKRVVGDQNTIYPGMDHRFRTLTRKSVILEVSTHHEDSDTYRVEEAKVYDRASVRPSEGKC